MTNKKIFGKNLETIRILKFGKTYKKNSKIFAFCYPSPGVYYESGSTDKLLLKKIVETSNTSKVNISDYFDENLFYFEDNYTFISLTNLQIKQMISHLIKNGNKTIEAFADESDISLRTLHRILNEETYCNFGVNYIEKIAKVYNLHLNIFFRFMELAVQDYLNSEDMQLKKFKELVENENLVNDGRKA